MSAWLATIRETFDIWISSRDADDASASAFASGESTLARISLELSRNSISISIKWFYSESNAATRRCRWPNQQRQQQRTNTFESDAPIQAQNSRRLLVWVNQRAASREESERASTTAIPHLCVCVCGCGSGAIYRSLSADCRTDGNTRGRSWRGVCALAELCAELG